MAREAIARFLSEYLPGNPDVKATLDRLAGEELVQAAVQAGVKADCAFTEDEFRDLMWAIAARKSGSVELSEDQLESVAGGIAGARAGKAQLDYLVIKLNDIIIT